MVCFPCCLLVNARLSIIDLSDRARMPMASADGETWITYNGETYNAAELREELVARGHRFQTTSDTEVVLRLYQALFRYFLSPTVHLRLIAFPRWWPPPYLSGKSTHLVRGRLVGIILLQNWEVIAMAAKTDEETIREIDREWSRSAEAKDAVKFASFYSDTGSAMPFNAPMATGRSNVQALWTDLMAKPGFSLRFAPTRVEVAKSGDLAYDIGMFELKLNDPQGSPLNIPGKYVVIWKKQKGGEWKAEADIFNTDK